MKNTFVKVIALALVIATLACVFASCGKTISGTYSAEAFGTGVVYEFKGSKVFITLKVVGFSGEAVEGKYEINDDKITFTFESDDSDVNKYNGEFSFEKGEDYIKIGGVKYTKQ